MRDGRQLSSSANMNYERSTLTTKNQISRKTARPLTVDSGEGEDEDGTSASNCSAQQQG